MSNWDYGDVYKEFPCEHGTVVFDNNSKVKVCDLTKEMPEFMRSADLIFVDPPWNQANISSFYTKADKDSAPYFMDFHAALMQRIDQISPGACYIEIGKERLADTIMAMRSLFPYVTFFNSSYYHRAQNICYVVYGGKKRPKLKLDGLDEETIIERICNDETYECIGDLCMGRGLVGINAYKAGRRFVGTELNHKRLSILLQRIVKIGGTYRIEEDEKCLLA